MPSALPNNKYWSMCETLNTKNYEEMNEDEKKNVEKCQGVKNHLPCLEPVYRCPTCGYFGCVQNAPDVCSEQGFIVDICMNCGAVGTAIPVLKSELAACMLDWNVEFEASNMMEEE